MKVTFECEIFPWTGVPGAVLEEVLNHPKLAYVRNIEMEDVEDEDDWD